MDWQRRYASEMRTRSDHDASLPDWFTAIERGEDQSLRVTNEERLSDDELTALALGLESVEAVNADTLPLHFGAYHFPTSLGSWYMPPVSSRPISGWRLPVAIVVVATLVVLEVLGLCSVFGEVVIG